MQEAKYRQKLGAACQDLAPPSGAIQLAINPAGSEFEIYIYISNFLNHKFTRDSVPRDFIGG